MDSMANNIDPHMLLPAEMMANTTPTPPAFDSPYIHLPPHNHKYDIPVILVPGDYHSSQTFIFKPDGQPGWAFNFAAMGFPVYLFNPPDANPIHPSDVMERNSLIDEMLALKESINIKSLSLRGGSDWIWDGAVAHSQWPSDGSNGVPTVDRYFSMTATGPGRNGFEKRMLPAERQERGRQSLGRVISKVAPNGCILIGEGSGATLAWLAADSTAGKVKCVVAVEPQGPPFCSPLKSGYGKERRMYTPFLNPISPTPRNHGLADAKFNWAPALPEEGLTIVEGRGHSGHSRYCMQDPNGTVHQLVELQKAKHLVVTGEASPHQTFDWATVKFMEQAGLSVEHVSLHNVGISGNGPLCFLENNSQEIAGYIVEWLVGHGHAPALASPSVQQRSDTECRVALDELMNSVLDIQWRNMQLRKQMMVEGVKALGWSDGNGSWGEGGSLHEGGNDHSPNQGGHGMPGPSGMSGMSGMPHGGYSTQGTGGASGQASGGTQFQMPSLLGQYQSQNDHHQGTNITALAPSATQHKHSLPHRPGKPNEATLAQPPQQQGNSSAVNWEAVHDFDFLGPDEARHHKADVRYRTASNQEGLVKATKEADGTIRASYRDSDSSSRNTNGNGKRSAAADCQRERKKVARTTLQQSSPTTATDSQDHGAALSLQSAAHLALSAPPAPPAPPAVSVLSADSASFQAEGHSWSQFFNDGGQQDSSLVMQAQHLRSATANQLNQPGFATPEPMGISQGGLVDKCLPQYGGLSPGSQQLLESKRGLTENIQDYVGPSSAGQTFDPAFGPVDTGAENNLGENGTYRDDVSLGYLLASTPNPFADGSFDTMFNFDTIHDGDAGD